MARLRTKTSKNIKYHPIIEDYYRNEKKDYKKSCYSRKQRRNYHKKIY